MKPLLAALLLTLPLLALPAPGADAADPVIVAVLDTGILADHAAFAPGQVVAWYDFGTPGGPTHPMTTWDTRKAPYDPNGHGTAVASLVGGVNPAYHTPSYAPGVSLAVAKISSASGSASWVNVHRAIVWATDVVGADIISLSFYAYLPQPGVGHTLLTGLRNARADGVLPVVLAGNGLNNMGLPALSWASPPASSPHALVVGGARASGAPVSPFGSMDPEVTALYTTKTALPCSTTCSGTWSGTSFSTPLVAGMAAHLLQEARDNGIPADADRLEVLLKRSARDTDAPPNFEGYGFLDADALARAETALLSGTTPDQGPMGPVNEAYVEGVQAALRAGWSGDPTGLAP